MGPRRRRLTIRPALLFLSRRTDVLVGPGSKADIRNINLLATLLVHAQSADGDGYWSSLGASFADELVSLLDRHLLSGLVEAPWICASDRRNWGDPRNDQMFFGALQELTAYAAAEATRLDKVSSPQRTTIPGGILNEMQALLAKYRNILTSTSEREHGDAE